MHDYCPQVKLRDVERHPEERVPGRKASENLDDPLPLLIIVRLCFSK